MKKAILFILVIFTLCCGTAYASNDYSIINMAEFSDVEIFSEGLCAVQDTATQRWGFVDVNKNWVISPQYKKASYFKNGLTTATTVDNENVLIDRKGKTVFSLRKDAMYVDSENYFLEKHNAYNIIWQNAHWGGKYLITLVDSNYKTITPENVNLCTFTKDVFVSVEGSKTVFWEDNLKKVYNYKGIDITDKLTAENIALSDNMIVNDKYIVGLADNKLKCFDIDGNKIAEFDNASGARLRGDLIVCSENIYNIPLNKKVFSGEYSQDNVQTYYNKYFTIKKQQGTTALYSYSGDVLVDFGKWDYIYPSAISNYIVVASSSKYGIADYAGSLVMPLEYSAAHNTIVDETGRYALLKQGNDSYYYVNLSTLEKHYYSGGWDIIGFKYLIRGNTIMDNDFNVVYVLSDNYKIHNKAYISNGIIRLYRNSGNQREYAFLLFNDKGGVKVNLNGTNLAFDELPTIQNGRTLVPMRAIFEALGASVDWNGETQSITAQKGSTIIQMQIGSNTIIKDGQNITIDVAPSIIGGRTMVPVRAISDCFNIGVDWNGDTQTVSLFSN